MQSIKHIRYKYITLSFYVEKSLFLSTNLYIYELSRTWHAVFIILTEIFSKLKCLWLMITLLRQTVLWCVHIQLIHFLSHIPNLATYNSLSLNVIWIFIIVRDYSCTTHFDINQVLSHNIYIYIYKQILYESINIYISTTKHKYEGPTLGQYGFGLTLSESK